MTSNLGAHIIQEKLENIDMDKRDSVVEQTEKEVVSLLRKTIRPEFLNRIDEIVMFTPLNKEEVKEIVKIQILSLQKMLLKKGIKLNLDEQAIDYLSKIGFDPQFGARPIKRVIQREILNELSKLILSGSIDSKGEINITSRNNKLIFEN